MPGTTIEELELDFGERLKSLRLRQNIDRATLAAQAGCSLSAIKNIENGAGSTMRTLIAVVRVLGREEWLRTVTPMATISPLSLPKAGRVRQRASATGKKI